MQKNTLVIAFLIAMLPLTAAAQCSISAWVEDPELPKATTKVHQSPNLTSKELADLPFSGDEDDKLAMLKITGYSPARVDKYWTGWVRISEAITIDGQEVFKGDGWIPANRVRTNTQTPTNKPAILYASPSKKDARVGTVPTGSMVEIVGFNCFGFKVKYKGKTGWLPKDSSCGNPVTTCN